MPAEQAISKSGAALELAAPELGPAAHGGEREWRPDIASMRESYRWFRSTEADARRIFVARSSMRGTYAGFVS
jgi:hypothetical protein